MPVVGVTGIVEGRDIRVFEARESLRFALERPPVLFVDGVLGAHDLEGYTLFRLFVFGFPDDSHAALAEDAHDSVSRHAR